MGSRSQRHSGSPMGERGGPGPMTGGRRQRGATRTRTRLSATQRPLPEQWREPASDTESASHDRRGLFTATEALFGAIDFSIGAIELTREFANFVGSIGRIA